MADEVDATGAEPAGEELTFAQKKEAVCEKSEAAFALMKRRLNNAEQLAIESGDLTAMCKVDEMWGHFYALHKCSLELCDIGNITPQFGGK